MSRLTACAQSSPRSTQSKDFGMGLLQIGAADPRPTDLMTMNEFGARKTHVPGTRGRSTSTKLTIGPAKRPLVYGRPRLPAPRGHARRWSEGTLHAPGLTLDHH
jgi:hypothetical protein